MHSTLHDHITDLVSRWSHKSLSDDASDARFLPTALDLFRIGSILHVISKSPEASPQFADVRRTYHDLLRALPLEYCNSLFQQLFESLSIVLRENVAQGSHVVQDAVESLAQLLDASPLAVAASRLLTSHDMIHDLALCLNDSTSDGIYMLLFHTVLSSSEMEWQVLIPLIHLLQEENIWLGLIEWTNQNKLQINWKEELLVRYNDDMQQDYLRSILFDQSEDQFESAQYVDVTIGGSSGQKDGSSKKLDRAAVISPEETVQQRIDQIKQILPLGEGYIETALSYYNGDVERTVQALLSSDETQLPIQLQLLDKSLPRRAGVTTSAKARKEQEEARETTKKMVMLAAKREEDEAYLIEQVMIRNAHDEYNDDYDDQYDDMGGSGALGGTDSGLYDNYEAVMAYNRNLREIEHEQSFWEASRNTNRQIKASLSNDSSDDAPQKTYRGPEKLKGGRIPNAGRGNSKGREKNSQSDKERNPSNMTSNAGKQGRGGGRGRGSDGRGSASAHSTPVDTTETQPKTSDVANGKSRGNQRRKAHMMAKRREKQKQAGADRSG